MAHKRLHPHSLPHHTNPSDCARIESLHTRAPTHLSHAADKSACTCYMLHATCEVETVLRGDGAV
jgi:hypothetical protein